MIQIHHSRTSVFVTVLSLTFRLVTIASLVLRPFAFTLRTCPTTSTRRSQMGRPVITISNSVRQRTSAPPCLALSALAGSGDMDAKGRNKLFIDGDEREKFLPSNDSDLDSKGLDVNCQSTNIANNAAPEAMATTSVSSDTSTSSSSRQGEITSTGLKVLVALALQNCSKNLLVRYVMKESPSFLLSAAVIGSEMTKLTLSTLYILIVDRRPLSSIVTFLREDVDNTKLLVIPAAVYNLQQTLEFIALSNLDASVFSVLVQSKLLMTAIFSVILLGKRLRKAQVVSLVLLTAGVVLCNLKDVALGAAGSVAGQTSILAMKQIKGVAATLGIALASGFAAVYTEKVIKKKRPNSTSPASGGGDGSENISSPGSGRKIGKRGGPYSLAYMQVQLALVSLVVMGFWAVAKDAKQIAQHGLFQNFTLAAFVSVFNSGVGGLMVAAVLKYADSVLKGYATAISVVLTGVLSMALFGTSLNILYGMGIVNVISAVILYNANDLDKYVI